MRKIFLDVGAHEGQTLRAVIDLPFDRVYAFEPVPDHWDRLAQFGSLVTLQTFGLSDVTGNINVYDPGSMGASMWQRPGRSSRRIICEFRRASDWMRANLEQGDEVYMKLNCEGAELDILNDLASTGNLPHFKSVLVMFDAHKIPELHEQLAETRVRLKAYPNVLSSKEIPPGLTHTARIRNWLRMAGLDFA